MNPPRACTQKIQQGLTVMVMLLLILRCRPLAMDWMRTSQEPKNSILYALHFTQPRTVFLYWDQDLGADEYLLYRDITPHMSEPELIYQGKELEFADTLLDADNIIFYYYQMAKRRGTKIYPPSPSMMGIASDSVHDEQENNDTQAQAKELDRSHVLANIFYFRDRNGATLEDVDHYYLDVKPMHRVVITLGIDTDRGNLRAEDLYFAQEGLAPQLMLAQNGVNITLHNTNYATKRIYFSIYPNRLKFIDSLASGGKFGFYRIDFLEEAPYQPK
jgi:hypothetical protein